MLTPSVSESLDDTTIIYTYYRHGCVLITPSLEIAFMRNDGSFPVTFERKTYGSE